MNREALREGRIRKKVGNKEKEDEEDIKKQGKEQGIKENEETEGRKDFMDCERKIDDGIRTQKRMKRFREIETLCRFWK